MDPAPPPSVILTLSVIITDGVAFVTQFVVKNGLQTPIGNYIPEKHKFSGILCFHQQRSRRHRVGVVVVTASQFRCQRDNF